MKLFDTHAHVNFNAYKEDSHEVIERAYEQGVHMALVGAQLSTSKRAIRLAEAHEGAWAAVGLHPFHLEDQKIDPEESESADAFVTKREEFDKEQYKALASHPSVVAIGEVGLDFWQLPKKRAEEIQERQKKTLYMQCKMASELDLPVLVHCRGAHQELISLFQEWQKEFSIKGVIHCFTGTSQEASSYMRMGFFLGINGIVFKLSHLESVIKEVPSSSLVLETDCPYLTPPHVEERRNEPAFITHIAERVAQIRECSTEEIAETTFENAHTLFSLS